MRIFLDNSAFSLMSCDIRFQRRVIQGLTEGSNTSKSFGDAVHKALEYLDKGMTPDQMLEKLHSVAAAADIPKVLSLITYYKSAVKLPPPIKLLNGEPAVEVKFCHPYGQILVPGIPDPVEIDLVGTIDRIWLDNDILVIGDYKTTAHAKDTGIQKTLASYATSFQLSFYLYALTNFGILPASYQEYLDTQHYRLEIHLLCHNASPPIFKKYIRHAFSEDYMKREVPLIINSKIQQAIAIATLPSGIDAPHTGFTVYGACDNCGYRNACLAVGTAREKEILSGFETSPYNPLNFR